MIYTCKKCGKSITYNPQKQGKGFCQSCGNQRPEQWTLCIDCDKRIQKNKTRCRSCFKVAIRSKGNPNYIHSKVGNAKCIDCEILLKNCNAQRCWNCYKKYAIGKNSPNYINGESVQSYPSEFTVKLREEIRQDNDYVCQICGMTEEEHITVYGQSLSVHHIDYKKKNCSKTNLTVLCIACNNRVNYNKDYWKKYFQIKQDIKNNKTR